MPPRIPVDDEDADVRGMVRPAPTAGGNGAMSGGGRGAPEVCLDMARRLGAGSLLRKPFTRAEMLRAVEQALNP